MKTIIVLISLVLGSSEAFTSGGTINDSRVSNRKLLHDFGLKMTKNEKMTQLTPDRRSFVKATLGTASIVLSTRTEPALASEESMDIFKDEDCGFQIKIPSDWEKSVQNLPDRRKIVLFVDPKSGEEDKTLVFVAFTPVRDDFTQLSSFGSVDQVAQMTILPKSRFVGEETDNEMISAESKKNSYYFDYTSESTGQPKRHFRTIFSLAQGATGGAGAVLVTLTAQTLETKYSGLKGTFDEIIDSYGKVAKS